MRPLVGRAQSLTLQLPKEELRAKEIILYNLNESFTDEKYGKYGDEKERPFRNLLRAGKKFTLVKAPALKIGAITTTRCRWSGGPFSWE